MKFYGEAEATARKILDHFKTGNVPKALSNIFIEQGDTNASKYSFSNQFLVALSGFSDARGFKDWINVGRMVDKGQKAIYILAPVLIGTKKTVDGEEKKGAFLAGFRHMPVFGLEQTSIVNEELWEKKRPDNSTVRKFLNELPLRNVAEKWGLKVTTYDGTASRYAGWYNKTSIALGVQNLSTWAHELIHAADDRLKQLKGYHTKAGKISAEVVAELGGAILLYSCGYEREADIGGAYEYIQAYAASGKQNPIDICMQLINRTCNAVALILEESGIKNSPENKENQLTEAVESDMIVA